MANALSSFGNPEFLKDLELLKDLLSVNDLGQQQTEGQARSDVTELADPFAEHRTRAASAYSAPDLVVNEIVEEFRLNQLLEQARLATGATGAAIALVRGEKIVCRATSGSDAPSLGTCLDPGNPGLSSLCIQTRQLQHCNDTETDPRVNPEARRSLGVRSITVLPLIDGDELFGIFEVLSSRPNAFGQSDLNNLQALADRILENRRQEREANANLSPEGSGSFLHLLEVAQDNRHASESHRIPRRERASRINNILKPIVAVLVLGAAVLFSILVAARLGWHAEFRRSLPPHRANRPSKTGRTDHTVPRAQELLTGSAPGGESGADGSVPKQRMPAGIKGRAQPPRGGSTANQDSIIFRRPPSEPSRTRDSQTSQHSPGMEADPEQR